MAHLTTDTHESDEAFVEKIKRHVSQDGPYAELTLWPEVMDRLLSLASRGAAVQWRPIEEAPRDGTPVSLWRPKAEQGFCWKQRVDALWDQEIGAWVWPDGPCVDIGGHNSWLENGQYFFDAESFTHWMPLPLPPSPSTQENENE